MVLSKDNATGMDELRKARLDHYDRKCEAECGAGLQVQKIRLLFRSRGLGDIRVGTVNDLQGQEERIIFISTVLSRPESMPKATSSTDNDPGIGFWRNPKRFNVAITRAKALLVVLGHPVVLFEVIFSSIYNDV